MKLEDWLSKNFSSVISFIEKNVMIKLQSQFSKLFSQWFSMLVPDNFNVRLSDDFSPIIEYSDYEMDYAHLSGGERTAIALAYRLALNQVINSVMSKIKTRDLIILDEPTDGFSEQQLDKMRDVLFQLDAHQMIIVSHEQKIEGFVENLIRFKKADGISKKEE
jgi:exonuclease SbcC